MYLGSKATPGPLVFTQTSSLAYIVLEKDNLMFFS